jgi:cytoskeletal protein CcmA (bactofilin family)
VVAADLAVQGELSSDGELMVDGLVCGDVSVRKLVVGLEGRIVGNVTADSVDLYGEIRGNVTAAVVRLYKSARAFGDLTQGELSIEAGAVFEGRCLRADAATSLTVPGDTEPARPALAAPAHATG